MDYQINYGYSLNPQVATVSKTDTPRELLNSNGITFQDGEVSLNGQVLGTSELDSTFEALGIEDNDYLVVATKQNSGGAH